MEKKDFKKINELQKQKEAANKAKRKRSLKNFIVLALILASLIGIMYLLKQSSELDFGSRDGKRVARKKIVPLKIKEVQIEPLKPYSRDIIRAIPVLNRQANAKTTFIYRWFVNDKELLNLNESILPESYRRKNNQLYCIVKAIEGDDETDDEKSPEVKVANSPPTVGYQKIENFTVPGDFFHKIEATDPDGDPLEFELTAPLDMGAAIDPKTGEITWHIKGIPQMDANLNYRDDAPTAIVSVPDAEKAIVTFLIKVKDTDGAVATASFRVNLMTGTQVVN